MISWVIVVAGKVVVNKAVEVRYRVVLYGISSVMVVGVPEMLEVFVFVFVNKTVVGLTTTEVTVVPGAVLVTVHSVV